MQKFVDEKNISSSIDGEILIGENYKLFSKKKLGSGAFGDIYKGLNIKSNEEVAIKLEPIKSQHPQLFSESKVYNILQGGGNEFNYQVGMPTVYWSGIQGNYNIMVIELLGPSIEDLFSYCQKKFSNKTVVSLAEQMVILLLI